MTIINNLSLTWSPLQTPQVMARLRSLYSINLLPVCFGSGSVPLPSWCRCDLPKRVTGPFLSNPILPPTQSSPCHFLFNQRLHAFNIWRGVLNLGNQDSITLLWLSDVPEEDTSNTVECWSKVRYVLILKKCFDTPSVSTCFLLSWLFCKSIFSLNLWSQSGGGLPNPKSPAGHLFQRKCTTISWQAGQHRWRSNCFNSKQTNL